MIRTSMQLSSPGGRDEAEVPIDSTFMRILTRESQ